MPYLMIPLSTEEIEGINVPIVPFAHHVTHQRGGWFTVLDDAVNHVHPELATIYKEPNMPDFMVCAEHSVLDLLPEGVALDDHPNASNWRVWNIDGYDEDGGKVDFKNKKVKTDKFEANKPSEKNPITIIVGTGNTPSQLATGCQRTIPATCGQANPSDLEAETMWYGDHSTLLVASEKLDVSQSR